MEYIKKIVAFRVGRFAIVGTANTIVNFMILNLSFYALNQSKITSSLIATSCAIVFSFILNRNFVFMDKERPAKKFLVFIAITAGGVLLIQNSVYAVLISLLNYNDLIEINVSNLLASLCVMFWNYNGYKIFVFHGKRFGNEIIEEA